MLMDLGQRMEYLRRPRQNRVYREQAQINAARPVKQGGNTDQRTASINR
jgi:hypothetical protein